MENLSQKHGLVSRNYYKKFPLHGIEPVALKDLALYDNENWNDPRDFAIPVKAISLPQDVRVHVIRTPHRGENQVMLNGSSSAPMQTTQVNLKSTSFEICSGPTTTQYCMEDPE
ncbi:hypothetical protein Tco_0939631 [Tanacetum coccineum]|uniref:Uncharacterized protein n=1 Tax=Tanacetum coccineum TaxID=301880 RepID=A0ABQ5DNB5_9ASTR